MSSVWQKASAEAEAGMVETLDLVAILASALFAGAAVYINVVEHPARLSCGTEIAARQWAPSYKRATFMQATLAIVATLAGVSQWMQTGRVAWLYGAAAIFAVVPVTLAVIFPTNKKLLEPARDPASSETRVLLERWGRLHAIRSVLSVTASIVYIWTAVS
jgi:hypothetical protein